MDGTEIIWYITSLLVLWYHSQMAGTVKLVRQFQPTVHFVIRNAPHSITFRNRLICPNQASCLTSLSRNSIKSPALFKSLEPKRSSYDVPQLLQNLTWRTNLTKTNNYIKILPRSFFGFGKNKDEKPQKKRVPKLILIQNPFKWLMLKLDFSVLRNVWDPEFTEKDFKYGSKQVREWTFLHAAVHYSFVD